MSAVNEIKAGNDEYPESYHCHCTGRQQLCRREDSKVGHVSQHVDDGDHGQGDVDCTGQVLVWLLQFFSDKIKIIPASVAKKPRVERQGNPTRGGCCVLRENSRLCKS